MPDVVERFGARVPAPAGRGSRRATDRVVVVVDSTRDFFEQTGQFSTSRLWRQKVGTGPVYERRRAPAGALPKLQRLSGPAAYGLHFEDWRFWTTV